MKAYSPVGHHHVYHSSKTGKASASYTHLPACIYLKGDGYVGLLHDHSEIHLLETQLRLPNDCLMPLFEAEYNKQMRRSLGKISSKASSSGVLPRPMPSMLVTGLTTTSATTLTIPTTKRQDDFLSPPPAPPTATSPPPLTIPTDATQPQQPDPLFIRNPCSPPLLGSLGRGPSISCPQLCDLRSPQSSNNPAKRSPPMVPVINLSVLKGSGISPPATSGSRPSTGIRSITPPTPSAAPAYN